MKKRKSLQWIPLGIVGLILIIDSKTAVSAAKEGISLCLEVMIPALFPFLFLSALLTSALWGTGGRAMKAVGWFFGFPQGTEALMIPCLLGGYPVGADAIAKAWRSGQIQKQEAEGLLFHGCYAGPAFLFGVVGTLFPPLICLELWGIHLLSGAVLGLFQKRGAPCLVTGEKVTCSPADALNGALSAMGKICGWIVLFRILTVFLQSWFLGLLPIAAQGGIIGLLELSNGCILLAGVKQDAIRFLLVSGLLSFGGLCVYLQTLSVIAPLDGKSYLKGKCLMGIISLVLSWMVLTIGPVGMILPCLVILFQKFKNKSGNLRPIRV